MPSPNPTHVLRPAELRRRMSEHVLYEIEQCASALHALVADARTDERDFPPLTIEYGRGNAVIEDFLLQCSGSRRLLQSTQRPRERCRGRGLHRERRNLEARSRELSFASHIRTRAD